MVCRTDNYDLEGLTEVSFNLTGDREGAVKEIAVNLSANSSLTKLDLQGNMLGNYGCSVLADALRLNNTLTELNLENNGIDEEGAAVLEEMLDLNNSVTTLNVRVNNINPGLMDKLDYKARLNSQPLALKRAIPKLVANDPSVESVNLSEYEGAKIDCDIIADALRKTKTLLHLDLSNTLIGDPGAELIASALSKNSCLLELGLSNTRITRGAKYIAEALKQNSSLTSLVLSHNKLGDEVGREFVDTVKENDALIKIDLEHSAVSSGNLQPIKSGLFLNEQPLLLKQTLFKVTANDPDLTEIDFNEVPNMELSAVILAPALKKNTTVKYLNLSGACIGDEGVKALAGALKFNSSIEELELPSNEISLFGATDLAEAVGVNQTLTDLNLAQNEIGDEGCAALITALVTNNSCIAINVEQGGVCDSLKKELDAALFVNQQPLGLKKVIPLLEANDASVTELDFSVFDGERYHNDNSCLILAKALENNNTVTKLNLANNNVSDTGAANLARVINSNGTLKRMDFTANSIGDKGAEYLCQALKANKVLSRIDMENNNLTEIGGLALLEMLQINDTITSFPLKFNRITPTTISEIELACAMNKQPLALKQAAFKLKAKDPEFVSLDASVFDGSRYFTDVSVTILAHELIGNTSLARLNLANNTFEAAGMKALTDWLQTNSTLTYLNIANNTIADLGATYLATAMRKNDTLKMLNLSNNGIGDRGAEALIEALAYNNEIIECDMSRNDTAKTIRQQLDDSLALNAQPRELKSTMIKIKDDDPSTIHVDLNGSTFGGKKGDDVMCRLLAAGLMFSTKMESLDLSNNNITDEGITFLCEALEENKSLKRMNLSGNKIGEKGVGALIEVLNANDFLEHVQVDKRSNSLDPTFVPPPQHMLDSLSYSLMLNNQPKAFKTLIGPLRENSASLTALDFSKPDHKGKRVDDEAVALIAEHMRYNDSVKMMSLANNHITAVGAASLGNLLKVNTVLERLDLSNNQLGEEGGRIFAQALKHNHTLQLLAVGGNGIDPDTVEDIEGCLHINTHPVENRHLKYKPIAGDDVTPEADFRTLEYFAIIEHDIFRDAMQDNQLMIQ